MGVVRPRPIFNDMKVQEQIILDLKQAMKDGAETKKTALRMLLAEITKVEIEKHKRDTGLENEEVISLIARAVKMRQDAAEAYERADRSELREEELAEKEILSKYLPPQIADEELREIIQKSIAEMGVKDISELGKVMGVVMKQVQGKADGSRVRSLAQELLGNSSV